MPSFDMISTELRRKGLKIRELPGEYRVERGGAVTVSATLEEAAEYGRSLPAAAHRPPSARPEGFPPKPAFAPTFAHNRKVRRKLLAQARQEAITHASLQRLQSIDRITDYVTF
jgi:hypothetical protein